MRKKPPRVDWFFEKADSHRHRSLSANPNLCGVGLYTGQGLDCLVKQPHADGQAREKRRRPR